MWKHDSLYPSSTECTPRTSFVAAAPVIPTQDKLRLSSAIRPVRARVMRLFDLRWIVNRSEWGFIHPTDLKYLYPSNPGAVSVVTKNRLNPGSALRQLSSRRTSTTPRLNRIGFPLHV